MRPPEIPAIANQQVLVALLHAIERPWSAASFSPDEVLAIAYAPSTQWPEVLALKVEQILEANAGTKRPMGGQSFPRVAEWSADQPSDRQPPATRPEGGQRRHCLTLVVMRSEDREDAEKWPGLIQALVEECSRSKVPEMQRQPDTLEGLEEALCYILECLVQELTGEAKSELRNLVSAVETDEGLDPSERTKLLEPIRECLGRLRVDSYDATARSKLVALRRRIHELRRRRRGLRATYTAPT